jgi:hypothetical protein
MVTEVTQTRDERLLGDVQPYFEPRYDKVDQKITSPVAGTVKLIAEIRGDE